MRALALALAFISTSVCAQDRDERGWYGGLSVGRSRVYFNENNLALPFAATSVSKDENDTAYKLFAGYQLNRHFALEGGWTRLGEFSFTRTIIGDGSGIGKFKASGWFADALGILPLGSRFSLFGKLGGIYSATTKSLSTTGTASFAPSVDLNPTKRQLDYTWGIGASYALTRNWAGRLEYEMFKVGDSSTGEFHVYVLSLGATYRF
jgi:OmpA-OmpF porin, OOP family